MKTILLLFTLLLKFPAVFAQQAVSEVVLAKKINDVVSGTAKTEAYFFIGESTREFKASIVLNPLIPGGSMDDAPELKLVLKGTFPLEKIDFMTTADNGKMSKMLLTAQLNEVSKEMELPFTLFISTDAPFAANGNDNIYQPRLNAELIIDPKDFGLATAPYNVQGVILIGIKNAVLNK
ncbi:hypothetical protein [Ferruginibacter sp. HRS2-29]|uniref:hypothetical protein n=1 Tax=Ferruginibacter sp. HRS2-29 TaxID=2487334 RepID=UPI0020CFA375|nr:hypothetical protein [Ferruginibacter sp. HRS2-29]MCP9749737.1 hypothetical protein [Ferruginibacter sp. HRS2-29]